MTRRHVAAVLGLAGLLMTAGGQLHPRGKGETVDDYLESMLGASTWVVSHTLSLVGVVVAVVALAMARRISAFGPGADRILTFTAVAWGIAAVEAVPHLLAIRDHTSLQDDEATPILDLHLLLQMGATPLFGFMGALLALAVAREAGTVPAKVLAVLAVIGGLCYGAAGPLVNLTESVAVTPLFIGQAGLAIWVVGTAVRLAFGKPVDEEPATTETREAAPSVDRLRGVALRHALVVGLAATAMLALPMPHSDAATTPGRNGWIVFTTGPAGDGNILRTNATGTATQALTGSADHDGQPVLSPTGAHIAFASQRDGNVDIWVMDADGGDQTRLTTGPWVETSPAWSPDGRRLYFVSNREGGLQNIYVMNADGTDVTRLTDAVSGAQAWGPAPSPDGRRLAFVSDAGPSSQDVFVMDADGGPATRLTAHPATDNDPAWSPDGRTLAFSSDRSGVRELHLMDADGTDVRRLTVGGTDYAPDFAPDGSALVFVRYVDDQAAVWRVDVDGTDPVMLQASNFGGHPSWGASPVLCQGQRATIAGTEGNDVLRGTPGPDVISGLGGNDTLVGFDGADVLCGGTGTDTVSYAGHEGRVTADLAGGVGDDGSPEDGALGSRDSIGKDVENLTGGFGDDTLVGSSARNALNGGAGDDVLRGGLGADTLLGAAGRDTLLAVDDLRDARLDCGAGTDAAARRDRVDPRAVSCP